MNSPKNLSVAQYVCFILLFFIAHEVKNRFKNLKDYYRQIKREKLKSDDGVTAIEEGQTTSGVVSKKKKTEWVDDPQRR